MAIGSGVAGTTSAAKRRRNRLGESSLVRAISSAPVTVRTKLLVGFARSPRCSSSSARSASSP